LQLLAHLIRWEQHVTVPQLPQDAMRYLPADHIGQYMGAVWPWGLCSACTASRRTLKSAPHCPGRRSESFVSAFVTLGMISEVYIQHMIH
jgi:hypothetical protein